MEKDIRSFVGKALGNPADVFNDPKDVVDDQRLNESQKKAILDRWESLTRAEIETESSVDAPARVHLADVLGAKGLLSVSG